MNLDILYKYRKNITNTMNMNTIPLEVELIIYRYVNELNMNEIRKEICKNIKTSIVYELKWKGVYYRNEDIDKEEIYDKEYDMIMSDKNISSLYFRNKLEKTWRKYQAMIVDS